MWGYPSDVETPIAYWGARAIKEGRGFTMLHDRQSCSGEQADKERLVKWVNSIMPKVQKWAHGQGSSSSEVFELREGEYMLRASCNASYGYVYVGAWQHPSVRLKTNYTDESKNREGCRYGLATPPEGKWSGTMPIPSVGQRVKVNMNDFGEGVVVAYFVEHGYVGVEVDLDKQPEWHLKQNGPDRHVMVFGIEVKVMETASA